MPRDDVRKGPRGAAEKSSAYVKMSEYFTDSINTDDPVSIVGAMRFLAQMATNLAAHGNQPESIKCSESVLLLRRAHENAVAPLIGPLIEEGLLPSCSVEHAADIVLRCNNNAVNAFNEKCFDVAEFFLAKALFLTDSRAAEELNYFPDAESRRIRLRAATLNNLGCMEKRRGRLEESLKHLRQAVELEVALDRSAGGSPSTYLNLCTVLNELQRHDEAVIAVESALAALDEQMLRQQRKQQLPSGAMMLVVGLYNLGVSLELRNRDGDVDRAKAVYQRTLDACRKYFVDPSCPTVEMAMAAIQRMHGGLTFREGSEGTRVVNETPGEGLDTHQQSSPTATVGGEVHSTLSLPQQMQVPDMVAPISTSVLPSPADQSSLTSQVRSVLRRTSVTSRSQAERSLTSVEKVERQRMSSTTLTSPNVQKSRQELGSVRPPLTEQRTPQSLSSLKLWEPLEAEDGSPHVVPDPRSHPSHKEVSQPHPPCRPMTPLTPSLRLSVQQQEELRSSVHSTGQCVGAGGSSGVSHHSVSSKPVFVQPQEPLSASATNVNAHVTEWRSALVPCSRQSELDELQLQVVPGATKVSSLSWSGSSLISRLESVSGRSGPSAGDPSASIVAARNADETGSNAQRHQAPKPHVLLPIKCPPQGHASAAHTGMPELAARSIASLFDGKDGRKSSKSSNSSRLDAMSLFGRRRFTNVAPLPPRKTSMGASISNLTPQQALSVEKHLMRAQLGQKKAEEQKGTNLEASRSVAIAKARERELKRLSKIEAKQDAALAGTLYEKFVEGMRADELKRCNRAAVVIQRVWRGALARTLLVRMVVAAKRIQRPFRVHLVKILAIRMAEEMMERRRQAATRKREEESAIIIQNRVRQFLRRLEIRRCYLARRMRQRNAACRIQRGFRSFLKWREEHLAALIEAQRLEEEKQLKQAMMAAQRIQFAYKCYLRRKREFLALQEQERRDRAAEVIQARMRGVLARAWFRYYKAYHREQELRSAANQKRIIVIQTAARTLLSSQHRRRLEIELICQLRFEIVTRSVTKIQCQWRSRCARIRAERLRAERAVLERRATRIKRWYLTRVARRNFLAAREQIRRNNAATIVVQWYRMCKVQEKEREMARYHEKKMREAKLARLQAYGIVILQASFRGYNSAAYVQSMRRSFLRLTLYAEVFQRVGRGYRGRVGLFRHKCAVIQEAQQRIEATRRATAACVVQRAWRCAMAKEAVAHLRRCHAAATMISKHHRAHQCRKQLRRLQDEKRCQIEKSAAIVMQTAARRFLYRLHLIRREERNRKLREKMLALMRCEEAATTLQAIWRGRATRRALEEERKELSILESMARKMQRMWRRFELRRKMKLAMERNAALREKRAEASLKIQCFWRKMIAAEKVANLRQVNKLQTKSASVIQRWWRFVLARKELTARKRIRQKKAELQLYYLQRWDLAVTVVNAFLQTRWSQKHVLNTRRRQVLRQLTDKERELFLRRHASATKIQKVFRGHYERVYLRGVVKERMEEEKRQYERMLLEGRCALAIQCAIRRWHARRKVDQLRIAKNEKKLAEELERCATVDPQEVVRNLFWIHGSILQRDNLQERIRRANRERKAAVALQKVVRGWLAKKKLVSTAVQSTAIRAASTIKTHWKKYLERKRAEILARKCRAATVIQSHYRGYIKRRNWRERQMASEKARRMELVKENNNDATATVLQSFWRRIAAERLVSRLREERRAQKLFHMANEAATTIQQFYGKYRKRRNSG